MVRFLFLTAWSFVTTTDYTHPDDRTLLNDMTPGFKPFTILKISLAALQ